MKVEETLQGEYIAPRVAEEIWGDRPPGIKPLFETPRRPNRDPDLEYGFEEAMGDYLFQFSYSEPRPNSEQAWFKRGFAQVCAREGKAELYRYLRGE